MTQQVLEGTWEEIAAHADELSGKRLKVIVEAEALEADEPPNIGPPNLGPPNEPALRMLRELEKRQKGRPYTSGEGTQALIRQARDGGMYGREPLGE